MKSYGRALLFTLIATLSTACAFGPESGTQLLSSREQILFSGFAEKPGDRIDVEAYDKQARLWRVVGTTTSSTTGFQVGANPTRTLYHWAKYMTLAEMGTSTPPFGGSWMCFIDAACYAPRVERRIDFRFHEYNSSNGYLFTFGPGGQACMQQQLANNQTDVVIAYWNTCRPEVQNPVVYDDQVLTLIKPAGVGGWGF